MGLDQYAFAVMPHKANTDFGWAWRDEEGAPEGAVQELAYWRKHANLQGWMQRLWEAKREAAGDPAQPETEGWFAGEVIFNCQPVRVTFQDLANLEDAISGGLDHAEGFFWGASMPEDDADTLAFIAKAREAIGCDMEIYYDSWW